MSRTALVAGATGLVGGHLLRQLLADDTWERVISIGRHEVDLAHPALEQHLVDFEDLGALAPVNDAFSFLGTTIKKAGSQDAFRAIDHDAVLSLARAALDAGATRFLHVTALGANPRSRIFYNRVKGEIEHDVAGLGFATTVAFQPSILDGARVEARPGERISLLAMRAIGPLLGRYRPTRADDLARAMLAEARDGQPGVRVVPAGEISRTAQATG